MEACRYGLVEIPPLEGQRVAGPSPCVTWRIRSPRGATTATHSRFHALCAVAAEPRPFLVLIHNSPDLIGSDAVGPTHHP